MSGLRVLGRNDISGGTDSGMIPPPPPFMSSAQQGKKRGESEELTSYAKIDSRFSPRSLFFEPWAIFSLSCCLRRTEWDFAPIRNMETLERLWWQSLGVKFARGLPSSSSSANRPKMERSQPSSQDGWMGKCWSSSSSSSFWDWRNMSPRYYCYYYSSSPLFPRLGLLSSSPLSLKTLLHPTPD